MKNFRQKIIHNKIFKDRFFIKEDFWEAEIKNSSFVNCTFLETIFCDVKFENVKFQKCVIKKCNFSHSFFFKTFFNETQSESNNFRDCRKDHYSKIHKDILIIKKDVIKKKPLQEKEEEKIFYALTKGPGYYVLKNFYPKSKIKTALDIVDKKTINDPAIKANANFFSRDKKFNQKWIYSLLNLNKVFIDFIQPPTQVSNVFKKLLGERYICGFYGANCLLPGARGQSPHLDYPYYRFVKYKEKVPFYSRKNFYLNCQILIPLTVFNKKNGSTGFLPDSHKLNKFPELNSHKKNKFLQITINPGSVLIFNGLVWHYAAPNYSDSEKRYGLLAQYIPEFITPLLDLKSVTQKKILKSNNNLKNLLGLNLEYPSIRL